MDIGKRITAVLFVIAIASIVVLTIVPAASADEGPNLLTNPGAETNDLSGWTIIEGSWGTLQTSGAHEGSHVFVAVSYNQKCKRSQEIDLLAEGYTEAQLDASPTVNVEEWFKEYSYGCANNCRLKVSLLDENHDPIVSWSTDVQNGCCSWERESHIFSGYSSGLRYIYFEDCGTCGVWLDDASVCIDSIDTTPPEIDCPADVEIECDTSTAPANTGSATATDNCDPSPTITYSDSTSGTCPEVITRTWTATDDCGNSVSCTQTITVVDTTAPVITCPDDVELECGVSTDPSNTGSATATDNCDPSPTITYSDSTSGTCPEVITRTWTATDDCGNSVSCTQTITVVDTTAPVITCPDDVEIECGESTDPSNTGYATATDNCDPSPTITYSDSTSGTYPEVITRTWTATYSEGNSISCIQTITVVDTTAPVITCPDNVTVEQERSDGTVVPLTATATDICDANVSITSDAPGVFPLGVTIVTFTATDDSGNSASCTTTVTVIPWCISVPCIPVPVGPDTAVAIPVLTPPGLVLLIGFLAVAGSVMVRRRE